MKVHIDIAFVAGDRIEDGFRGTLPTQCSEERGDVLAYLAYRDSGEIGCALNGNQGEVSRLSSNQKLLQSLISYLMRRLTIPSARTAVGLAVLTTMQLCSATTPGQQNAKLAGTPETTSAPATSASRPAVATAQQTRKQDDTKPEFGGTYEALRPEQRRLVDDWFARYNKRIQKTSRRKRATTQSPSRFAPPSKRSHTPCRPRL